MSDQDVVQIARDLVTAFNNDDWDTYRGVLASDCVYDEVGTSQHLQGIDSIIEGLQGWKTAMPDAMGSVGNTYAAGDTAVLEITWTGTHTGPLQGPSGVVPATGKPQVTRSCWVLNFDGGKLKESRHYFDMLSFMQQLGVLPG